MPDNPADRVQFMLGLVIFAAVALGLLVSLFLRYRRWRYERGQDTTALLPMGEGNIPASHSTTGIDPYAIAHEALKLVDQVQAENDRLKAQLARQQAKHPHGGTLSAATWLAIVNDDPNLVPHVGIEGATRTGKTTLAEGILHARTGRILILTAKTDDDWNGLPFLTVDDDGTFRTVGAAFRSLHREVQRRLVATKHREDPGEWLTVVLDDYPALRDACPEADAPFLLVARIGASLRVRLLVLTYSLNVKELGLEGKGDARHHFVWIKRTRHGSERTATMLWEGRTHDLDTASVVALASRPLDPARAWQPPTQPDDGVVSTQPPKKRGLVSMLFAGTHRRLATTTPDADALLQQILQDPTSGAFEAVSPLHAQRNREQSPVVSGLHDADTSGIEPADADTEAELGDTSYPANTGNDTTLLRPDLPDAVIRALLHGEKWSGNRIAQYLYGSKQKRLQRIEQATRGDTHQTEETEAATVA